MTAILGAGMSGLSAGFYLLKQRHPSAVTIYEASNRIGGWIRSERFDDDGFIFEGGPRTMRTKGPAAINSLNLIDELGLADQVRPIHSNHVAARNRMVYAKGKLNMLPSDVFGLIKVIPPFTKPLFFAGIKDLFTGRSKPQLEDETIYEFTRRRFGKEIADYAIGAMICGICAGDAKQISVKFLLKHLFELEQKYGGVFIGLLKESMSARKKKTLVGEDSLTNLANRAKNEHWSIYSLNGGLQQLPDKVGSILSQKQVDIQINVNCKEILFDSKKVHLLMNGQEKTVDHLISAIPSHQLAKCVAKQHPNLSKGLDAIPFVDVAVINLRYNSPKLQKHEGFGFLVPPIENLPILGVIFDSCCFDMKQNTVLTVMMGGAWFHQWFGDNPSEEQLLDTALKHVNNILKIDQTPNHYKVNILRKCIPQYVFGHHKRVEKIKQYIRENNLPIALCGASYDGVGVNDVILSAKTCVETLFNKESG
ncbi:protoporphyrinogen oxidase [Toxorhynchites rutilus septentrionalis]|uniref:protoporphyrinogen oxidase n=1 Tax=Toxorhynchites rutilus septentrionalis TaxID=329112 RepID=UPI002479BD20|nr:protoporphyrinogen oxidase [Toxorhynchites rutilus septentrionalis]XP_055617673.1 protoporphyrinogen oxidase [Toxorhynchites rutilus septentrionalis]